MRRHFLFLALILCSIGAFGQQDSSKTQHPDAAHIPTRKIAEFPGGHQAFVQAVISHFRTSQLARLNIESAKAMAVFDIDTDGSMINVKIESADNEIVKKEFLQALSKVKTKWEPGEEKGIKVKMRMRQPLQFYLD